MPLYLQLILGSLKRQCSCICILLMELSARYKCLPETLLYAAVKR